MIARIIKNEDLIDRIRFISGLSLAVLAAYLVYTSIINYAPKPLVNGFEYSGRYYDSGCVPPFLDWFMCYSTGRDEYFYSTNTSPEKVTEAFPGWKIKNDKVSYDGYGYNARVVLVKNNSDEPSDSATLDYVGSNFRFVEPGALLLPSDKKYVVKVWYQDVSRLSSNTK